MAVIEPCIFPTPPDILLVPAAHRATATKRSNSRPSARWAHSAASSAMASARWRWRRSADWIVSTYHLQDAFERFRAGFQKWGMLDHFAKGLTPIPVPFILVAVASGVTHLNLAVFVISATIKHAARAFFEAWLIYKFGDPIRTFHRTSPDMGCARRFGGYSFRVLGRASLTRLCSQLP